MRKHKFIYTLSALLMACIISLSGVGGTYLYARAENDLIDALWNTEASSEENIWKYIQLFSHFVGAFAEPTVMGEIKAGIFSGEFAAWMLTEGYTEDTVHDVMCGCGGDHGSHTDSSGYEHGGGGFVRDGISVDDSGNLTYSDEVSDLFYAYIKSFLVKECGYLYWRTNTVDEIPVSWKWFTEKSYYDNLIATIETCLESDKYVGLYFDTYYDWHTTQSSYKIAFIDKDTNFYCSIAGTGSVGDSYISYIDDSWNLVDVYDSGFVYQRDEVLSYPEYLQLAPLPDLYEFRLKLPAIVIQDGSGGYLERYFRGLFSSDGSYIRIWYDMDKFKMHTVGQEPYYVTNTWNSYNSADDNSVTMTNQQYQYYTDNSNTFYETIQNNIDNSTEEITEQNIQIIVNNTYNQFVEDSKTDNSGNDSGSEGEDSSGSGIGDLFDGIGKIFDTILSLIGKLMGVVADFTQSILDLFSGFTTFTDGFSDFLAGAFGFIPAEIWDIVKIALSLMTILAVIKFLRK